ncbi:hypothetical protein EJ04DRAFT_580710 [Polyplosphaeria fusca]|uniref:Uncharacterized protein n=1 Tax=Polyplosphaeria fusca TaxID=682080 RepID=A0A9P4UYL6_9PLEO|nr:hypothetical protein EJ04DRAFT_580710 [Polyplosphaeria fusca]
MATPTLMAKLKALPKEIYWEAPVMMFLSFLFAIFFAVGHHVFYVYMDGQPASDNDIQQWMSRFGTALAFLVKVLFGVSASMAYVQWFWYKIRKTPITLARIDDLYGVIYEPMKFWHVGVWIRHYVLAFLAITTWVLPISAIFTPGAITVKQKLVTSTLPWRFPEADFASPEYCNVTDLTEDAYKFARPCKDTNSIAHIVLTSGQVAPVPAGSPGTNVSYQTSFYGPAVSCAVAPDDWRAIIDRAVLEYRNVSEYDVLAFAFTPEPGFGRDLNASYLEKNAQVGGKGKVPLYMDIVSTDIAKTYFYAREDELYNLTTLYSCGFYNASYRVNFSVSSTENQQVQVEKTLLNPLTVAGANMSIPYGGGVELGGTPTSYLSIMKVFNSWVTGALYLYNNSANGVIDSDGEHKASTSSMSSTGGSWRYRTLVDRAWFLGFSAEWTKDWVDLSEEFMQNLTVSARYGWQRPNLGSGDILYGTEMRNTSVNATTSIYETQFEYRRMDLAISYGVSALFSAICLGMGTWAMVKTRGSFSHNFSNIFRFVRAQEIDYDPEKDVRKAADPLPKEFSQLVLRPRPPKDGNKPAKRVKTMR